MILVSTPTELEGLLEAMKAAPRIGLDIEGNGLYVYRAQLCVVQVAWVTPAGATEIAIIDPLGLDLSPLGELVGERGPVKVLHDLTFDARLLFERGLTLGNVHDTSVMAQLSGEPKSGLQSLLERFFDVRLEKGLQDHDWARRPFNDGELAYLAEDVRYLLELDDQLSHRVREQGIEAEVEIECHYKLRTAFEPPRDQRPPHERIKGFRELGARSRAVLEALTVERERLAAAANVPPFRAAPNGLLLEMARRLPRDRASVERICRRHVASRHADAWLAAVERGLAAPAGAVAAAAAPAVEPLSGDAVVRLKRMKSVLTEWRKKEAQERGVTLQVVVPGHAMGDVAAVLAAHEGEPDALLEGLSAVAGLGDARIDRYLGTWLELSRR